MKTCKWTCEDDGYDVEYYQSACGRAFCFMDGGPTENDYVYCPGCGGRITQADEPQEEQSESVGPR